MFILIRISTEEMEKYPTNGASAGRKESFLIGQFEFAAAVTRSSAICWTFRHQNSKQMTNQLSFIKVIKANTRTEKNRETKTCKNQV